MLHPKGTSHNDFETIGQVQWCVIDQEPFLQGEENDASTYDSLTSTSLTDHLLHESNRNKCSDITNTQVGISGETVPEGGISFQLRHLVSGGSNFYSWCVTPHSSPSRGCWQHLTIFNILNFYNNYSDRKWTPNSTISLFCWLFSLHSSPPPLQGYHMIRVLALFLTKWLQHKGGLLHLRRLSFYLSCARTLFANCVKRPKGRVYQRLTPRW